MNSNLQLVKIIRDRITNSPQQKITFADYMKLALYHPQFGYYASNADRIGRNGDFLTSSYYADDFGYLLAIQIEQFWQILGCPKKFTIVEMGAGQGLLAAQILEYLKSEYPNLFAVIDYVVIEAAPAMVALQKLRLNTLPVRWCEWTEIPDRSIVGCFLSNELIDAFPVHQVIVSGSDITDRQLQEIYVKFNEEEEIFTETIGELSTPSLNDYWQLNDIDLSQSKYLSGYRTEVNLAALSWLKTVTQKLECGYIISIDYGYSADRYYNPMRDRGTLQCYYNHDHHNNPYVNIGNQDLTAHVDFTAIKKQGELFGLETVGLTQQGIFLMALGLGERIAAISSSTGDIQSLLTRRQNLHQLIDPMALGKFSVLIQSKGLSAADRSIIPIGLSMG